MYEFDFLGYRINSEGVRPMLHRVEAILKIKKPETVRQLREIIGPIKGTPR